jgi:ABC-type nitrate/sulfonate/bicarbonate transport system ATPase subunit
VIELKHVSKEFAARGVRVQALDTIDLAVDAEEFVALVGPSGCGKSTVLNLVSGLLRPTHGEVWYEGALVNGPNRRVGYMTQKDTLLPWRTVEDNIRLIAPAIDEPTLAGLFDTLGLSTHRTHFPGELSLGLARRVALARAFAVEPRLLILDEPFTSLDQPLAARLRDELALLVDRRPVTTLLVTHDLDEAVRLADRLFLLSARPARLLATMPIPRPRAVRSAEDIAALKAAIAQQQPLH